MVITFQNPKSDSKTLRFQGLTITLDNVSHGYRTTAKNNVEIDVTPIDSVRIIRTNGITSTYQELGKRKEDNNRWFFKSFTGFSQQGMYKPFRDIYKNLSSALFKYHDAYRKASFEYFIKGQNVAQHVSKTPHIETEQEVWMLKTALKSPENNALSRLEDAKSNLFAPILKQLLDETSKFFDSLDASSIPEQEQEAILRSLKTAKDVSFEPASHSFRVQQTIDLVPTPILGATVTQRRAGSQPDQ